MEGREIAVTHSWYMDMGEWNTETVSSKCLEAVQLAIRDANGIIANWCLSANPRLFNHDDLKSLLKTTLIKRLRSCEDIRVPRQHWRNRLKSAPTVYLNDDFTLMKVEFPAWDGGAIEINKALQLVDLRSRHVNPSYPFERSIESIDLSDIRNIKF